MPPKTTRRRKRALSSTSTTNSSPDPVSTEGTQALISLSKEESEKCLRNRLLFDNSDRVSVDGLPVYVDVASQTAYYLSVHVIPPYSEYVHLVEHEAATEDDTAKDETAISTTSASLPHDLRETTIESSSSSSTWTVRVGDTVIVHTDSAPLPNHHHGSSNNDTRQQEVVVRPYSNRKYAWFPFTVSWSPAEVVSIYRKFSRSEAVELRNKISTSDEAVVAVLEPHPQDEGEEHNASNYEYVPVGGGEIMMEVRWLYRTSEVPIVTALPSRTTTTMCSDPLDYRGDDKHLQQHHDHEEEVFETDHVDQCSTLCLLAPLELKSSLLEQQYTNNQRQLRNHHPVDVPKLIFSCYRFWSVRRRCLVPVGSLLSRAARGRLHSREIQRNHALKVALETALVARVQEEISLTTTTDDFEVLQQQLTFPISISSTSTTAANESSSTSSKQLLVEAASTFALASAAMDAHSFGIPLRGRENEQRRISNFLRLAIRSGNNGRSNCTMFIAGPPGTGKTSSVKCVIAQLVEEQSKGLLPEFNFVYINCMELRDPFDAYVSLWEGITGEKRTAAAAAELLERHFVSEPSHPTEQKKKKPTNVAVVLLDEIDYLTTNKQTVLYNFFNWPLKSDGLVVLGISNTINLPERLHPRVQSRLGAERCIFQSYKVQEVVDILSFRLSRGKNGPCDVAFDKDAITFAARKTAVFTGDIRKAFQLCRVAAECVIADIQLGRRGAAEEGRGGAIVRIPDVQRAARDLLDSPMLKAVATCTSFEALVLVSLAALRWSIGRDDGRCRVQDLLIKMRGIANSLGDAQYLPVPSFHELIEMLNRLGEARFLTLSTSKMTRVWSVQLNIANDELKMALHNSAHQELAQKNLKSFII